MYELYIILVVEEVPNWLWSYGSLLANPLAGSPGQVKLDSDN